MADIDLYVVEGWFYGEDDCSPPEPDKRWFAVVGPEGEEFCVVVQRKRGGEFRDDDAKDARDRADRVARALSLLSRPGLPAIPGEIAPERYMALRQHAGDGKLGDATIEVTTTAGLGGLAILVEVKPAGRDTVYAIYDVGPHVQAIAEAVLELDRVNAEAGQ